MPWAHCRRAQQQPEIFFFQYAINSTLTIGGVVADGSFET